MSFTHTVTQAWGNSGASSISQSVSKTGSAELLIDESMPNANDTLLNGTIDVSEIEVLFILSDKAITIETNSSSAPDNTLVLVAGEPLIWTSSSLNANPLTADVTKFYITNASGAAASLKIRVLTDATP